MIPVSEVDVRSRSLLRVEVQADESAVARTQVWFFKISKKFPPRLHIARGERTPGEASVGESCWNSP